MVDPGVFRELVDLGDDAECRDHDDPSGSESGPVGEENLEEDHPGYPEHPVAPQLQEGLGGGRVDV